MMPSDVAIGRFRELWHKHYGEELSEEDARTYATSVLDLGEIVYSRYLGVKERAPP